MSKHDLVLKMEFGSHVYGTNVPTSDHDFKGIGIPDGRDIIMQRAFKSINMSTGDDKSRNTAEDIDFEIFSRPTFVTRVGKNPECLILQKK